MSNMFCKKKKLENDEGGRKLSFGDQLLNGWLKYLLQNFFAFLSDLCHFKIVVLLESIVRGGFKLLTHTHSTATGTPTAFS